MPFLYATLAVAAALAIGELLTALTPIPNLSMLFLVAVLLIAVNFGIWPAIYASALSFLVYNFFFIEPLYTFTIAEPYELLALVIFLVVAVITSALAGRVRRTGRRFRLAACGRCAASMNSRAACPGSRRLMRWPKARPAKFTQALAARSLCCWSRMAISP